MLISLKIENTSQPSPLEITLLVAIVQDTYEDLKQLIEKYGYFTDGPYRLSGGALSDFYFDLRRVTMHPRGASLIAKLMIERLTGVDAVGGMESGAIPIATAIALKSGVIRAFFVRKSEKIYGRMRRVEGCVRKGDVVAFVEDVTTSGESALSGIAAVEQLGCRIAKVISVLDRESGAQERITSKGYLFEALFTSSDFKSQL